MKSIRQHFCPIWQVDTKTHTSISSVGIQSLYIWYNDPLGYTQTDIDYQPLSLIPTKPLSSPIPWNTSKQRKGPLRRLQCQQFWKMKSKVSILYLFFIIYYFVYHKLNMIFMLNISTLGVLNNQDDFKCGTFSAGL